MSKKTIVQRVQSDSIFLCLALETFANNNQNLDLWNNEEFKKILEESVALSKRLTRLKTEFDYKTKE